MIFVTGGTGLLGNCVIRELVSRGLPVRALCRKGTSRECFEGLDIEIVDGDLADVELLTEATAGCSAVIHSAALIHIGWKRLEEARQTNVGGTRRIVEACKRSKARLIYVSTVDTLPAAVSLQSPIHEESQTGIPKTPCTYVISKREAEQVVRDALVTDQLDAVIIKPGFMLAPYDWKPSSGRMMLKVSQAPLAIAPVGGCSLCDARDVAVGIVNAIDRGRSGQSYILAGENMSYRDLWTRIMQTTGKKTRVICRKHMLNIASKVMDLTIKLLPIPEGDINGAAIALVQLNHFYDSSKAQRELNYTRRPTEQTLRDAWSWLYERSNRSCN